MIEILLLGFFLGIRHAMESDHIAAVATLVSRSPSVRESIRLGSIWGLGHTTTLLIFGSSVILLDQIIPERLAMMLEFAVGAMLVLLGIDVLRRLIKTGIHFHLHRHADGSRHWHAHMHHEEGSKLAGDSHAHTHPAPFPLRALLIGMMHGMAGSAALIALTLQSVHSLATGMIYIALFGLGSIAGMAALSVAIMFPLRHSARRFGPLHQYLQLAIGSITLLLGANIMFEIASNGPF
ncbi:urease accessory protein [Mariprofundus erugo]|uniref:Urease accessory protein n=1 Tax=Mariprofundus erugo TaxID=2528639 RepID=A0A5R9GWH2_9PROT|nr:urease accessory protein [Mariprofundus erugo]TLS68272.1 urease accessory protein [Mariprofundus erugo]